MTKTPPDSSPAIPDPQPSTRREVNRRRTHEALRAAAQELFLERGFDAVSVAQIAKHAGVTEKTAFNYFPTKEDLLYAELEHWEENMVAAIRNRSSGQTMLDAFCKFITAPTGLLAAKGDSNTVELAQLSRLILDTPSLLAREARTIDRYTTALADVVIAEHGLPPGDARGWVAAHAMIGVHRALLDHVRHGLASGRSSRRLATEVRRIAADSCSLLAEGLTALG